MIAARAAFAGAVAAVGASALAVVARVIGGVATGIEFRLGTALVGSPEELAWALGWGLLVASGALLALVYRFVLGRGGRAPSWSAGALLGAIQGLVVGIAAPYLQGSIPLADPRLLPLGLGPLAASAAFGAHVLYGAVVAGLLRAWNPAEVA